MSSLTMYPTEVGMNNPTKLARQLMMDIQMTAY